MLKEDVENVKTWKTMAIAYSNEMKPTNIKA
jgi:hypothetical protein